MPQGERSKRFLDFQCVSPQAAFDALVLRKNGEGVALGIKGLKEEQEPAAFPSDEFDEGNPARWEEALPGLSAHSRTLVATRRQERKDLILRHLYRTAGSYYEEHGHPILFFALGELRWHRAREDRSRRAPLLLIPAELSRGKGSTLKARWNQDQVRANLSLIEFMGMNEELRLPGLPNVQSTGGLTRWFSSVKSAIAERAGWSLGPLVRLGLFSFTKTLMWEDLDPTTWELSAGGAGEEGAPSIPTLDEWEPKPPEATYEVLDSDRYQDRVLQEAAKAKSFVVQGPPGTGKSQTVVNLISDSIARGKSVLFVSDKMAALDVVTSKMTALGLEQAVLDLHSHKAKPKHVLEQLERQGVWDDAALEEAEDHLKKLTKAISQVDEFREAMLAPANEGGAPVHEVMAMAIRGHSALAEAGAEVAWEEVPKTRNWQAGTLTVEALKTNRQALEGLARALSAVEPLAENPWAGTAPREVSLETEEQLIERLRRARSIAEDLASAKETLEEALERPLPGPTVSQEGWQRVVSLGDDAPPCGEDLALSNWHGDESEAATMIAEVSRYRRLGQEVGDRLLVGRPRACKSLLRDLDGWHKDRVRWCKPAYWQWRRNAVREVLTMGSPWRLSTARTVLEHALERDSVAKSLESKAERAQALFGKGWRGLSTDPATLEEARDWVLELHELARPGAVDGWAESGNTRLRVLAAADGAKRVLGADLTAWEEEFGAIRGYLQLRESPLSDNATWARASEVLAKWEGAVRDLQDWYEWIERREALETPARQALDWVVKGGWGSEAVMPAFESIAGQALFRWAAKRSKPLERYSGQRLNRVLRRFRNLDREVPTVNVDRVKAALFRNYPGTAPGGEYEGNASIIRRQVKSRRKLPIKRLFKETIGYLTKVFPCFVMTPLSVAQFLPDRDGLFDLVIFDEASQVRPEDALGSILRASQMIVVGDSKQLPPSTFFDKRIQEDSEFEEEVIVDQAGQFESVLDLAAAVLPEEPLRSHYRSRDERLITVSNVHFYDGNLLPVPTPHPGLEGSGPEFRLVPGVYQRGIGRSINPEEARQVALDAVEHAKTRPHESLGIVTMSTAQQRAVQDDLELLLENEPTEVRAKFVREAAGPSQYIFVKNLETVQGDERDRIFVSVGYGKDEHGILHRQFGPLSSEGGERRLNVLMTRAKLGCQLYANFRGKDLSVEGLRYEGPKVLKSFLDFYDTGEFEGPAEGVSLGEVESPLEAEVKRFVEGLGYRVVPQVGSAGYRVDLAVQHPEDPGRYALGIECDGAAYHSSQRARDRDRLRQEILEERGWRIHRVWSTDWFRYQAEVREEIVRAVQTAVLQAPPTPPPPPVPPDVEDGNGNGSSNQDGDHPEQPKVEPPAKDGEVDALDLPPTPASPSGLGGGAAATVPEQEVFDPGSVKRLANDLQDCPPSTVARFVRQVVEVEGPAHADRIVDRLRLVWGLGRAGRVVRESVEAGVKRAVEKGEVQQQGDFLFTEGQDQQLKRRQYKVHFKDPKEIPPEFVGKVAGEVLKKGPLSADQLAKAISQFFGYKSLGRKPKQHFRKEINRLAKERVLQTDAMGRIRRRS